MDAESKGQIVELLHRSAYALDHKDLDTLARCFDAAATFRLAIDGVDEVSEFSGLEAIMGLMKGALDAQTDVRRHVVSNIWFEAAGASEATVVSYLSLMATENGETQLITTGIYRDVVTNHSGDWLISARDLQLDRPY